MWWSSVLLALRQIRRNGLRAALTTLGVLIGVAAVIALVVLGRGATASVTQDLQGLGQNLLFVVPGSPPGGPGGGGRTLAPPFSEGDAVAIAREVPGVAAVAPVASTQMLAVVGNQNIRAMVNGSTGAFLEAREWEVSEGRAFIPGEELSGAPVALLGQTVKDELFGNLDAVGGDVRLGNLTVRVIGVLEAKGQTSFGQDQDNFILVPLLLLQRRIAGNRDVGSIMVSAVEGASTDRLKRDIELLLAERRHIAPGAEANFFVRDLKEVAALVGNITGVLTSLLAAIAAISLLVGGIGIMNIMLVAVTERTREIGLRLSIGARGRDVLVQFLVEAVVLSTLGGMAGVAVGLGGAYVATRKLDLPFAFDVSMLLLPFLFSVAIGVLFGFVPARKAAALNPIDALRHE